MQTRSVLNNPLAPLEDFLNSFLNFEKLPKKDIFWLTSMEFLCNHFKNPQNSYKSIHVAGSKGKGSVSAFIAAILERAGYKTGLYTSPHILDIRERVGMAAAPFSDEVYKKTVDEFIARVNKVDKNTLPHQRELTWFELMTAFAFLCFKNAGMEWAVFETGLGGRLDATNVILPKIALITRIELEHTEYLGNSTEAIAGEKAGIIKRGVPVCIAPQLPAVKAVFKKKAADMDAPLFFLDELLTRLETVQTQTNEISIEIPSFFSRPIKTSLRMAGSFQAYNAALAALAVRISIPLISTKTIEQGLATAFLPCRLESTSAHINNKTVSLVLDGAHTPESLDGTLKTFYTIYGSGAHLLFGCAADKDAETMALLIRQSPSAFSKISLCPPGAQKTANYAKIEHAFTQAFGGNSSKNPRISGSPNFLALIQGAIEEAANQKKVLLVTGSFYLAAEVKKLLYRQ